MPDVLDAARTRLTAVTAAASAVLVVTSVAGFALLGAEPDDTAPARATAHPSSLPLRIPAPAVTLSARPDPSASAPPTATGGARMPTAAQRDRQLARLAAVAAAVTPTPIAPLTGTSAGTGTDTGTGTGTDTGSSLAADDGSGTSTGTPTGQGAQFRLSSFNVLGSSHTRGGARGKAPGVVRIRNAAKLLANHDVDVAGFQELQQDQARELLRVTGGSYQLYPGPGKGKDSENSIGWRTAQWKLVRTDSLAIPYFNGHRRNMPVVLLQHRASGVQAWFGNFHNPAETKQYHHQGRWRVEATQMEAALANRLHATGVPLLITGDMNERAPYFCRLTSAAPSMKAAHGGSNGPGGCDAGRPRAVDWIFGTAGVAFSGYTEDRSHLVDITTDHPVIVSGVRIDAGVFPKAVG